MLNDDVFCLYCSVCIVLFVCVAGVALSLGRRSPLQNNFNLFIA